MLAETNKRRRYMISSSLEEYLKTIYVLKKQGQDIKVTTIANRMNCTKPSVNKAIKNLKANEMLEYEAYGEIRLTNKGEALAKKVLEAYDIVYVFLTEILEISKEEAKKEAIRLKAVMNDNTLNMLTKYVYKILGVYNLNCNYDINEEKCRCCNRKILNLKREENIDE